MLVKTKFGSVWDVYGGLREWISLEKIVRNFVACHKWNNLHNSIYVLTEYLIHNEDLENFMTLYLVSICCMHEATLVKTYSRLRRFTSIVLVRTSSVMNTNNDLSSKDNKKRNRGDGERTFNRSKKTARTPNRTAKVKN